MTMSLAPSVRIGTLYCALLVGASIGHGAEVAMQAPSHSSDGADFVPEVFLFPTESRFDRCTKEMRKWINKKVGYIPISCSFYPLFTGGMTHYENLLMEAGLGVFPFIAVNRSGTPLLRVAVTLPSIDIDQVQELRFVADDISRPLPISTQTRHLVNLYRDNKTLSLDLSTDILTPEFLAQFASADKHCVIFGEGGKRKLRISGDQARSISEVLSLYTALVEDSTPSKNAGSPGKK